MECMTMNRHCKGFTLIELMIAVVIVGIIASVAIPAYQSQVTKSRRADAQAALTSLANAMERYYTTNNTYVGASLGSDAGDIFPSQAPLDGANKYYNLAITSADATTYTITATPIGGSAQDGDGPMRVLSTGVREWNQHGAGTWVAW